MGSFTVGISDLKVCRAPDIVVTYALGSCIGICMADTVAGVGGLSHIMLPDSTQSQNGKDMPMRFADTAVPMLINQLVSMGASRSRLTAKIAGGAVMFAAASDRFNIGERNIAAVTEALKKANIPIVAKDVGLDYGRTVYFYPETGIMEVKAASKGVKQL